MKKNRLVALLFLVVVSICVSAQTISRSEQYLAALVIPYLNSDTTAKQTVSEEKIMIDTVNGWKEWKTVQNFTFGKDRGSLPMIADLHSLHPYFRDKISQLIRNCKKKGIELAIVESYRTHAKQSEYFGMGRKYTRSAGGKSKHQYGLAVDVVPVIDSVAVWDNLALWRKIGTEGEKLGLRWGGRWRSPFDPAHFEWTGGATTYSLATGALPVIPTHTKEVYPCIEDDIRMLKKYWEAWETEQSMMSRNSARQTAASTQHP
jgi:hypothetical protein